ncbi:MULTISPECIES: peroxidase-related enzyme [Streptomyces]|uniref:Alkylhydroperoxidase n=1 Tax=Streptomyces sviceus (strain ATCC 29083 / DSM 924 / JCM 4929 / NBRC 13980 / NCIMB 11184 / NRRL 5439 / UC 5370) TaxID=463191 RepID=B5HTB4_STRX2|nr:MULTISPECIES: peroxidase-related enzyme [Streptomyces]EDY56069.1 alkylhydroperoxidase [Streptomyces sviceus ATCC 29083]MYT09039.1 peroxidase-related enzyme [Streptomyces sp. SID5470]
MAFVDLQQDEDVAPEVRSTFAAVREEYGFVPNILRAMAHCPDLLQTFVPFWAQIYASPTIGPRLRALAALGTAKAQECTYCVAHMSASARKAGMDEHEIGAVGNSVVQAQVFDPREALILELADRLTHDPDGTTDELRKRLREVFSEAEIVNIVLAIGTYNLTSRFLKALSIDVEEIFSAASAHPE